MSETIPKNQDILHRIGYLEGVRWATSRASDEAIKKLRKASDADRLADIAAIEGRTYRQDEPERYRGFAAGALDKVDGRYDPHATRRLRRH